MFRCFCLWRSSLSPTPGFVSHQLPSVCGYFTHRIRKLYAIDILRQIISLLRANQYRESGAPIANIRLQKESIEAIQKFWGSLYAFLQCYPIFFNLSQSKTLVRLNSRQRISVTPEGVHDLLRHILPRRGGVTLDDVSLFAQQANPQVVYENFLLSQSCAENFNVKHNQHRKIYFFWKVDELMTHLGFGPGSNKPMAYALEAAAALLPTVPNYWVPLNDCLENVSREGAALFNKVGHTRVMYALRGGIQYAYSENADDLYIRRHPNFLQEGQEPCVHTYGPFALTIDRMLKIAFSLPTEPFPLAEAFQHVFPSVQDWLRKESAFSLSTIARMYPAVICVTADGTVFSKIRREFPLFVPDGSSGCALSEKAFDALMMDPVNRVVFENLKKRLETPSPLVFSVCCGHPALAIYHQKLIYPSSEGIVLLEDKKMLGIVEKCLQEDEKVSVEDMQKRIMAHLDEQTFKEFKQTLSVRYNAQLSKLIVQFYDGDIRCEQMWGSTKYGFHIYRGNTRKKEGSEFNAPEVLLREITNTIKRMTSVEGSVACATQRANVSALIVSLPMEARSALKKHGGALKFFHAFPEHFRMDDDYFVGLNS